jgi:hypothetical protein
LSIVRPNRQTKILLERYLSKLKVLEKELKPSLTCEGLYMVRWTTLDYAGPVIKRLKPKGNFHAMQ